MRARHLLALAAVVAACNSTSTSKITGSGGAGGATAGSGGRGGSGGGSGEATGTGGATATGGSTSTGGTTTTGGTTGSGGVAGTTSSGGTAGGATGTGGTTVTGGTTTPRSDAGPDSGSKLDGAAGGTSGGGSGGTGSGGAGGSGGTRADAGPDGRPDLPVDTAREAGSESSGNDAVTSDGAPCPYNGHVIYTLAQNVNPTTTEQQAYMLITTAMDQAVYYYNCYTDITKKLNVSYDTSVSTADGNVNGSIRFGSGTQYMVNYTAMHEIAHTVGVGQNASPNWLSFVSIPDGGSSGPWTGANATAELRAITGDATVTLTADHDHFWPYGLNKSTDPHAEPDLIAHCRMVMALRKDLGLQ